MHMSQCLHVPTTGVHMQLNDKINMTSLLKPLSNAPT